MIAQKKVNYSKKEISKKISNSIGLSGSFVDRYLDYLLILMIDELIENNIIKIKNFGTFKLIRKKERLGRNPKDKNKEYVITARNVIQFKASDNLKDKLNKNENF